MSSNSQATAGPPSPRKRIAKTDRSWWQPRVWLGANTGAMLGLLARNRFRVGWRQWHIALTDTVASFVNSGLAQVERAVYGRKVASTHVEDPIFIVGHWRTGTTLLHELLILDDRHTFPSTYQCLAPSHFLVSQWLFARLFRLVVPSRRPMDNMPFGLERPQEDEFGLCNLGVPSPYLTLAFPNEPEQFPEYYDLKDISDAERERWKRTLLRFLQAITYRSPGRLVLKSPPHTCRVETLLEMFPKAQFIHLVRDPYVVFPSTVHLWKSLYATEGLQTPTYKGLQERVFNTFIHMHERWEQTRGLIDPERLVCLRYEDLVATPVEILEQIYEQFELGEFDRIRPRIEQYLAGVKNYKTNRYQLTPEQRAEITRRWGPIIRQYGYDAQPVAAST